MQDRFLRHNYHESYHLLMNRKIMGKRKTSPFEKHHIRWPQIFLKRVCSFGNACKLGSLKHPSGNDFSNIRVYFFFAFVKSNCLCDRPRGEDYVYYYKDRLTLILFTLCHWTTQVEKQNFACKFMRKVIFNLILLRVNIAKTIIENHY